jgi:hypothetical protein
MKKPENNAKSTPKASNKAETEVGNYVRIGDDYFKRVQQPNKNGGFDVVYLKRSKATIIDDHGRSAIAHIQKYEGFTCVPSHTEYQQEINGFFNKYAQLSYKPKDGEFDHILQLLEHIFSPEHLNFALDYLQLLYTKPTQRLPIILLESKERGTGKSTFGSLITAIFEDNAIKLGNSDFESSFNAIWIEKLAIVVDETSLAKNEVMQMLKRLSTETGKVTANEKNKIQSQIDFVGKFFFMSNEEGKALPIEKGENRFAVFKVPTFAERGLEEKPDMEQLVKAEIPAFIYHLLHRKLHHPETSRLYFAPAIYHTPQLALYFANSRSQLAKAVLAFIKDVFNHYQTETVRYSLPQLQEQLKNRVRNLEREHLRKVLEHELGFKQSERKQRFPYLNLSFHEMNPEDKTEFPTVNTLYYEFDSQNPLFLE